VAIMLRTIVRASRLVSDSPRHRGVLAAIGALATFELLLSFKEGNLVGQDLGMGFILILGQFGEGLLRNYQAANLQHDPALAHSEPGTSWHAYVDAY
jgi:hypothetical protein